MEVYVLKMDNLFESLIKISNLENITKGRDGGVIVKPIKNLFPIVRTTTKYNNPATLFQKIHYNIIDEINKQTNKKLEFNNALVEVYNNQYKNMGFHTDQMLDIEDNICLFSCYNDAITTRKLVIRNKESKKEFEIELHNNSIVLFSTEFNKNHVHKIVPINNYDNLWYGITFRQSKTFINYDDLKLKIANEKEYEIMKQLKSQENKLIDFKWPSLDFTISPSDLMKPIDLEQNNPQHLD